MVRATDFLYCPVHGLEPHEGGFVTVHVQVVSPLHDFRHQDVQIGIGDHQVIILHFAIDIIDVVEPEWVEMGFYCHAQDPGEHPRGHEPNGAHLEHFYDPEDHVKLVLMCSRFSNLETGAVWPSWGPPWPWPWCLEVMIGSI